MKIINISLMLYILFINYNYYRLSQEVKTLKQLMEFSNDIINDREMLLDKNGIKYDNYIYIEKDNK